MCDSVSHNNTAPLKALRADATERWSVSAHAVDRYLERVERVPRRLATARLLAQCQRAHFVKLLPSGLELWRGPQPRRLRLRAQRSEDGALTLATVLEAFDGLRCR